MRKFFFICINSILPIFCYPRPYTLPGAPWIPIFVRLTTSFSEILASIQLPTLLTLALLTTSALPSFPFNTKPTFTLLKKLDHAFASLLKGQDIETGEALPGFSGGRGKVSVTEKVRVRGVVERGRVVVVEVAGGGTEGGETGDEEGEDEEEDGDDGEDMMVEGNHGRWEMEIARVYERTVVELGLALDTGTLGGGGGFG